MVASIIKNAEHGQVNLASTSIVNKITDLHGGDSLTLKTLAANAGNVYVGFDKDVSAINGFELDAAESLSISLPVTFGQNNKIEVYAITDNAGDDISFIKISGSFPSSSAGS